MSEKYTPCGGCGAARPIDRCINCHHDFGVPRFPDGGYVGGSSVKVVPQVLSDHPEPHHLGVIDALMRDRKPLTWDRYFMGFASHAALKSKDSTKVGAILVGPEGEVRLTGFNGIPRGVQDLPERRERPAKYEWASHAETNLIAFAAREGIRTKGCTVYTTHQPCAACSRTLIQAGIARVVYGPGSFGTGSAMPAEMDAAATMFREAGITCEPVGE